MAPNIFSGGKALDLDFLGNRIITPIIKMKDNELRKNAAQGANKVTTKPPIVGPTARPILLATALRVKADGRSDFDTNALIAGSIGVLIIVMPAPNANVNNNNKNGVVIPKSVNIPSIKDTTNIYPHVIRSILRLSKISDTAPDGTAKRNIGKVLVVVIRETSNGLGAIEAISQDAPTSYIAEPMYEKTVANHNKRYKESLKGRNPDNK